MDHQSGVIAADNAEPAQVELMFREHHARIVGLIASRFSPAIAEDVASRVFLKVLSGHLPDQGRPVWPWLRRVAINQAIDHLRTNRSHLSLDAAIDRAVDRDEAEDTVRRVIVLDALQQLSAIEQIAVAGSLHGHSAAEVARHHGRSAQAVHSVAARARARLRILLEPSMIPVAASLAWLRRMRKQATSSASTSLGLEAVMLASVIAGGLAGGPGVAPPGPTTAYVALGGAPTVQTPRPAALAAGNAAVIDRPPDPARARRPDGHGTGPGVTIDHRGGAAVPNRIVIQRPIVDTPFGPAGGGTTTHECVSHGYQVIPRSDDLYRLC